MAAKRRMLGARQRYAGHTPTKQQHSNQRREAKNGDVRNHAASMQASVYFSVTCQYQLGKYHKMLWQKYDTSLEVADSTGGKNEDDRVDPRRDDRGPIADHPGQAYEPAP